MEYHLAAADSFAFLADHGDGTPEEAQEWLELSNVAYDMAGQAAALDAMAIGSAVDQALAQVQLRHTLRVMGLHWRASGNTLYVSPAEKVTVEVRKLVEANKLYLMKTVSN